jgi:hypothetical protein
LVKSGGVARVLFVLIQGGYRALYCSKLYYFERLRGVFSTLGVTVPGPILSLVIVTAMCGIAVHLYLVSVDLSHSGACMQFQRLFPDLIFLDGLWAASPLLAGVARLAYLAFSQRTLIRNIYRTPRNQKS